MYGCSDIQYLFLVHQPCPRGKFAYQPSALAGVRVAFNDSTYSLQVTNALELSEIHTDEAGSRFESLRRLVPWEVATASLLRA